METQSERIRRLEAEIIGLRRTERELREEISRLMRVLWAVLYQNAAR